MSNETDERVTELTEKLEFGIYNDTRCNTV